MCVVWSIDDFDEFLKSQMNDPEFAVAYAALQDERDGIQHDIDNLVKCE